MRPRDIPRIAEAAGVSPSFVYRVWKGLKRSKRIEAMLKNPPKICPYRKTGAHASGKRNKRLNEFVTHSLRGTYSQYACRCEECRAANSEYNRIQYQKRKDRESEERLANASHAIPTATRG